MKTEKGRAGLRKEELYPYLGFARLSILDRNSGVAMSILDGNSGVAISSCGFDRGDRGVDLGRNSGLAISSCGFNRGTGVLFMRHPMAAWWTTVRVGSGVGAVERSPCRSRVLLGAQSVSPERESRRGAGAGGRRWGGGFAGNGEGVERPELAARSRRAAQEVEVEAARLEIEDDAARLAPGNATLSFTPASPSQEDLAGGGLSSSLRGRGTGGRHTEQSRAGRRVANEGTNSLQELAGRGAGVHSGEAEGGRPLDALQVGVVVRQDHELVDGRPGGGTARCLAATRVLGRCC